MRIIFFADSVSAFLELENVLKKKHKIIWFIYDDSVYKEAIKYGVSKNNILFSELYFPFFHAPYYIRKALSKFFNILFGRQYIKRCLSFIIEQLNDKFQPNLILTDTGALINDIKTPCKKATLLHSVTYKHFYLNKVNLSYDYIFLPGDYHKQRMIKYHKNFNFGKDQLQITGNFKISKYIGDNTTKKKELLNEYNLNPEWPIVLYAPTYDAFEGDSFFPDFWGDQFLCLENYAKELFKNKVNLIVKFHHYMTNNLNDPRFKKISDQSNVGVFKTRKNFDTLEGVDDLLLAIDILVGDTSGILTTAIFLNKKIIFIEPGPDFYWEKADIEKKYRPGYVCKSYEELLNATNSYFEKDLFEDQRQDFNNFMFYKKNTNAYLNLKAFLDENIS